MTYATYLVVVLTSLSGVKDQLDEAISEALEQFRSELERAALDFLSGVSPSSSFALEHKLAELVRELGRQTLESLLNMLESDDPEALPHDVRYEAGGYRRINGRTRHRHVATLFGTIELRRYPYRYWHRGVAEATIFPLEIQLGLVCGATPALAEALGRYVAQAGATQNAVLDRLRQQHAVHWGAERLRQFNQQCSQAMAEVTREFQVRRILKLLEQAEKSRGNRKPVLAAGRDGCTLCEYEHRFFEHATVGTLTVYDRSAKRLGTVYLAFVPEEGQTRMTEELTALIREVLRRWQGTLPRLVYVTDAGDQETKYYHHVLRPMRHPTSGQKLSWIRIVDYYHVAQRVWTMAEALFGPGTERGQAWARKMCQLLKKRHGASRVLHSAAALRSGIGRMSKARNADFRRAYEYLRKRTRFLRYHAFKNLHLPIGSGVTEAACKTIYAQRMKLSGMRWSKQGAQLILNLRVAWLSGIWSDAYAYILNSYTDTTLATYAAHTDQALRIAA